MSRRAQFAWGIVCAAIMFYAYAAERACELDRDYCAVAMAKYDGFVP
jgi:hypothetical protein